MRGQKRLVEAAGGDDTAAERDQAAKRRQGSKAPPGLAAQLETWLKGRQLPTKVQFSVAGVPFSLVRCADAINKSLQPGVGAAAAYSVDGEGSPQRWAAVAEAELARCSSAVHTAAQVDAAVGVLQQKANAAQLLEFVDAIRLSAQPPAPVQPQLAPPPPPLAQAMPPPRQQQLPPLPPQPPLEPPPQQLVQPPLAPPPQQLAPLPLPQLHMHLPLLNADDILLYAFQQPYGLPPAAAAAAAAPEVDAMRAGLGTHAGTTRSPPAGDARPPDVAGAPALAVPPGGATMGGFTGMLLLQSPGAAEAGGAAPGMHAFPEVSPSLTDLLAATTPLALPGAAVRGLAQHAAGAAAAPVEEAGAAAAAVVMAPAAATGGDVPGAAQAAAGIRGAAAAAAALAPLPVIDAATRQSLPELSRAYDLLYGLAQRQQQALLETEARLSAATQQLAGLQEFVTSTLRTFERMDNEGRALRARLHNLPAAYLAAPAPAAVAATAAAAPAGAAVGAGGGAAAAAAARAQPAPAAAALAPPPPQPQAPDTCRLERVQGEMLGKADLVQAWRVRQGGTEPPLFHPQDVCYVASAPTKPVSSKLTDIQRALSGSVVLMGGEDGQTVPLCPRAVSIAEEEKYGFTGDARGLRCVTLEGAAELIVRLLRQEGTQRLEQRLVLVATATMREQGHFDGGLVGCV